MHVCLAWGLGIRAMTAYRIRVVMHGSTPRRRRAPRAKKNGWGQRGPPVNGVEGSFGRWGPSPRRHVLPASRLPDAYLLPDDARAEERSDLGRKAGSPWSATGPVVVLYGREPSGRCSPSTRRPHRPALATAAEHSKTRAGFKNSGGIRRKCACGTTRRLGGFPRCGAQTAAREVAWEEAHERHSVTQGGLGEGPSRTWHVSFATFRQTSKFCWREHVTVGACPRTTRGIDRT
jgi:hypothetical protein